MASHFLVKTHQGTIFPIGRGVWKLFQGATGKPCLARSLATTDRQVAIERAQTVAVHTDQIFQRLAMTRNLNIADGAGEIQFFYTMETTSNHC